MRLLCNGLIARLIFGPAQTAVAYIVDFVIGHNINVETRQHQLILMV
jgi:hypothetical protein